MVQLRVKPALPRARDVYIKKERERERKEWGEGKKQKKKKDEKEKEKRNGRVVESGERERARNAGPWGSKICRSSPRRRDEDEARV